MSEQPDFIGFLHPENQEKENTIDADVIQKLHRYWVLAGLRQSKESLKADYEKRDANKEEYKRQLNYLRIQIFWHYLKNSLLFPIWFIKLLLPSFLKGKPNIWTNLKTILTKDEFHPLRMA